MRKLGIIEDGVRVDPSSQDAYARLFDQPLSRAHLIALAALFGWVVPDDGEVHSVQMLVEC
uniref:Uncharacterized protein n=1 Tax=Arundo donax TaxID=35708 RepID=A0A0A8Z4F8_ARUDO